MWLMSQKLWKTLAGAVVVALGAIQLIPVDRTNPPVQKELPAPPDVQAILRRSCNDCHSNETVWLWYSKVAPISWLVSRDVREGRRELNFSDWTASEKQLKRLAKTPKEIAKGKMPPWFYLAIHRDARLSPQDVETLNRFAASSTAPAPKPAATPVAPPAPAAN
jgi:Haem-binding domain